MPDDDFFSSSRSASICRRSSRLAPVTETSIAWVSLTASRQAWGSTPLGSSFGEGINHRRDFCRAESARTRYRSRQSRKTRYMAPQRMRIVVQAMITSRRPEWSDFREPEEEQRAKRPSRTTHRPATREIVSRCDDHWACWPWLLVARNLEVVNSLGQCIPPARGREAEGRRQPDAPVSVARTWEAGGCWSPPADRQVR